MTHLAHQFVMQPQPLRNPAGDCRPPFVKLEPPPDMQKFDARDRKLGASQLGTSKKSLIVPHPIRAAPIKPFLCASPAEHPPSALKLNNLPEPN